MMKGSFLVLYLIAMLLVLPQPQRTEAKGGWVRKTVRLVRRVVRPVVCSLSCHTGCNWACSGACVWMCTPVCRRLCNGKKKREFGGASFDTEELADDPRIHGAFPSALSVYDKDKDEKISMDEFSQVAVSSSSTRADRGTKEAFVLSDRNGDNYIDCKEFQVAPLRFAQTPTC